MKLEIHGSLNMAKPFKDPFDEPEVSVVNQVNNVNDELNVNPPAFADPFDEPEPAPAVTAADNYISGALGGLKNFGEAIVNLPGEIRDAYVGGPRDPEIAANPELTNYNQFTPSQSAKMLGAYATTPDPVGIATIAEKTIPGSRAGKDEYGNTTLTIGDKTFYVNKPGLSTADVTKLVADIATYYPGTKLAAGFAGVLAKIGVAFPAGFLTSLLQDQASQFLGSEQPADLERAMYAGLFQSGGELLAPAAKTAWNAIFGNRRFFANGRLTAEGEEAASRAGLNPGDIAPNARASFGANVQAARSAGMTNPESQAAAQMATDEFNVPFTRAQRSQNPNDIAKELEVRGNVLGERGAVRMGQFDARQDQSIIDAARQMQDDFNPYGAARTPNTTTGVGEIREDIIRLSDDAKAQTDEAYDAVREAKPQTVLFSDEGTDALDTLVRKNFNEKISFYDEATQKLTSSIFKVIDDRFANMKTTLGDDFIGDPNAVATLEKVEVLRRRINGMIKSASDAEKTQLINIKSSIDEWLDQATEKFIMSGDAGTIDLLKKARKLHATQKKKFGIDDKGDAGGKFIQKVLDKRISPEELTRALFGIGRAFPQKAPEIVKSILNISEQRLPQLQEIFWLRMIEPGLTSVTRGTTAEGLKGTGKVSIRDTILKNLNENRTVMETLFNKEQLAKMKRFAATVDRAITKTDNPSGSGYVVGRLARQFLEKIGVIAGYTAGGVPGAIAAKVGSDTLKGAATTMAARRAIKPGIRSQSAPIVPATSAAISDEIMRERRPEVPIR